MLIEVVKSRPVYAALDPRCTLRYTPRSLSLSLS